MHVKLNMKAIFIFAILVLGTISIISPVSEAAPTVSIYAIGGSAPSGQSNAVEKYDPSTNSWSPVTPMPTASGTLAAAVDSSGNIYAIGGASTTATAINTVQKYNPSTNTWTTVASLLTGRWDLAAATDSNGNIYAIGGMNYLGGPGTLNTVEKYNPSTNSWSIVASMSTARHGLSAATDSNGNIYAIGGITSTGIILNTVEKYNPSTNTWITVAPMPTARTNLAAAVDSSGNIYAIGGATSTGIVNTVEIYNPSTNTWTTVTVAAMPTARAGLAAAVDSSGNIYAIGGATSTGTVLSTVEKYNPSTGARTKVTSMPTARSNLAAVGAKTVTVTATPTVTPTVTATSTVTATPTATVTAIPTVTTISEGQCQMFEDNFDNAKEKAEAANDKFEAAKEKLDDANNKLEAARDSKNQKAVAQARGEAKQAQAEVISTFKELFERRIDGMVARLEVIKCKIENSENRDIIPSYAVDNINKNIAQLKDFRTNFEREQKPKELKNTRREMFDLKRNIMAQLRYYRMPLLNYRLGKVISKYDTISVKMDTTIQNLKNQGKDTAKLEEIESRFNNQLKEIKVNRQKILDLYAEHKGFDSSGMVINIDDVKIFFSETVKLQTSTRSTISVMQGEIQEFSTIVQSTTPYPSQPPTNTPPPPPPPPTPPPKK